MRPKWIYAARLALAASLLGLWLFAGMGQSYACSCVEPDPPAEALERLDGSLRRKGRRHTRLRHSRVGHRLHCRPGHDRASRSAPYGKAPYRRRCSSPRCAMRQAVGSPSPRAKNTSSTPGATPHHRRSASAAARVWPPMLRKNSTRWEKAVRRNPGPGPLSQLLRRHSRPRPSQLPLRHSRPRPSQLPLRLPHPRPSQPPRRFPHPRPSQLLRRLLNLPPGAATSSRSPPTRPRTPGHWG